MVRLRPLIFSMSMGLAASVRASILAMRLLPLPHWPKRSFLYVLPLRWIFRACASNISASARGGPMSSAGWRGLYWSGAIMILVEAMFHHPRRGFFRPSQLKRVRFVDALGDNAFVKIFR